MTEIENEKWIELSNNNGNLVFKEQSDDEKLNESAGDDKARSTQHDFMKVQEMEEALRRSKDVEVLLINQNKAAYILQWRFDGK